MKIRDDYSFIVNRGEAVTISIPDSAGVADGLSCSLNDEEALMTRASVAQLCTFKVERSAHLRISVPFSEEAGGRLTIRITGNESGDFHTLTYNQTQGEAYREFLFRCDLEGDPTTNW